MYRNLVIKKILVGFIITMFFGSCSLLSMGTSDFEMNYVSTTGGSTLYVGGSGLGNYSTITEAINSASHGDTVFVYNGTYVENIYINDTINLIGENRKTTIIDGNKKHDVIYIGFPANGVLIKDFTIRNSGNESHSAWFDAGIEIHSDYNHICNNIITKHPKYGICFFASKENNISFNHFTYCNSSGIEILAGPSNFIFRNLFYNNYLGISGVGNPNCKDNILKCNSFFRNNKGLSLFDSGSKIIRNNFFENIDFNAMSHFDFYRMKPSKNIWDNNYWDYWRGFGPKWIPGFLGFNFDFHPVEEPYPYMEEI